MEGVSTLGEPSWVDLSTPDVEGSARFYTDLLGWTVEKHSSPMGDYHIGTVDGRQIGGMMAAPPQTAEMPATWAVLFSVADVDATVAAVQRAGGSVVDPAFDLPDSRIAIVADPAGAVFGVVSHAAPVDPWLSSALGAVCWIELLTHDPDAAIDFYTSVLGWHASTDTYGDVRYTTFTREGQSVAGAMMMPDEVPVELGAVWSIYFAVEDCAATEHHAVQLGGAVAKPTTPVGEGRFAVLADPYGATFQVMDQQR
jgi:uncharacterized protein